MMKKILLLCFILFSINTHAQTVKRSKIVSNGGVHGMAYHPNVGMVVLHGGTHLGFPALNAQEVDKETGNPISVDFPFLDGFLDATSDDNGGWFIVKGGTFLKVDEYVFPANKYTEILHLKADYSVDTTFRMQKNNVFPTNFYGGILQILKYQNLLLTWCFGNGGLRLLAFDATNGSFLWDSKTEVSSQNLKMQLSQNRLYISGNFTKIDDIVTTTQKAICFNLDTKTLSNWNPTPTLNLQGYEITDMTLSGSRMIYTILGPNKIVATDTTDGNIKYWEVAHNDVQPTKLVADSVNIYGLSQNCHFDVVLEQYSKIVKLNSSDGQIDNAWTIPTNYTKKLYKLYLDQNYLYATADDDVTVLGTRTSTLIKINKTNRTVQNWKPFNDPLISGATGVYGDELKLKFLENRVLIGGNFNLLKHNKKDGIAIIRPESESIVNWYPNVKSCNPNVAAFENDSTLWVWGSFTTNENQNFTNHFAAFDIRTGNLKKYFSSNIPSQNYIKKMDIAHEKVIVTYEYQNYREGNWGYLQSYNAKNGSLENWITCGIVNNFFVRDSLLYTNVGICVDNEQRFSFSSVNLKTNQFTNWTPQYPLGYSGNFEDFVIVGNSVVVMTPTKYYEFDRFSGELKNSFGQSGDGGKFITAGEKYFFIARNGYDYYQTERCGNFTSAFLYDLEYKKFSENCFLQKPFSFVQNYYSQPSPYIDRQFFLAQNYLYFNVSWSGYNRPVNPYLGNFLRTSFPKGFFKDEINPAFFPKTGGNSGFVTINFYGYSFVDGCKIRLKKAGQPDIIVYDSLISYPERFRMEAKVDLKGKAVGDWNVEISLPNGEKSVFLRGFSIRLSKPAEIHIEAVTPNVQRPGAVSRTNLIVSNKGEVDADGVPIWLILNRGNRLVNNLFVMDSAKVKPININDILHFDVDSVAGLPFSGTAYLLFISKLKAHEVIQLPFRIRTINSRIPLNIKVFPGEVFDYQFGQLPANNFINQKKEKKLTSNPQLPTFSLNAMKCNMAILGLDFDNLLQDKKDCIEDELKIMYFEFYKTSPAGVFDLNQSIQRAFSKCVGIDIQPKLKSGLTRNLIGFVRGVSNFFDVEAARRSYEKCSVLAYQEVYGSDVSIPAIAASDPNDKLGPVGVKPQRYVNGSTPFTYKIRFENIPTATAAAQFVRVVDTLDRTKFNFDTFQFGYFNVADTNFYASPGKKRHLADWDLRPSKDLILRMESKFIDSTGVLEATYTALDPATMELTEDPILGFLPPNVNAPEGEGSLTFSIFPKDSLVTGTTISNKAYIYFDYNPVIPTPPWVNTIDATLPSSSMNTLPVISRDTTFMISWQGSDSESGAKLYDVMVSVNDNPYTPVLLASKFTNFKFIGKMDSIYKFYTVAYDSVYNKEPVPISFMAQTTVKFYPMIESINSGNWDNPNTWDCNCVPTYLESVRIKGSHRILITPLMNNVKAKGVMLEAGAVLEQTGTLKLRTD